MDVFRGRLGIQQRVLANYRAPFFDALARYCEKGLSVGSGLPLPEESITIATSLEVTQQYKLHNLHLFKGSMLLCYQRGIKEWLCDWEPDALIMEINTRTISNHMALRWMKKRSRPVLGWGLGSPSPAGLPRVQKLIRQLLIKSVLKPHLQGFTGLLTYSHKGATEYTSLGYPADRIFVAPNAVATGTSRALPTRPHGFSERPNILFVGRLQGRKRIDVLLRACASLPEEIQPNLTIIGQGPELNSLSSLARNIYPKVKFHGAIHGSELAPFFKAADLFILPGTGGLAVQEAMSYGLPIIIGEGDGTNDDLVRPENGWQFTKPEALAGILQEALSNVSRLRKMGEASYRIVTEEINLEKMVSAFLFALKSITSR